MIGLSMLVISIVVGIIVGAVVLTQLVPIAGTMADCPTGTLTGLAAQLQIACNTFVSFGGIIVVIGVIIGLVAYFRFFR